MRDKESWIKGIGICKISIQTNDSLFPSSALTFWFSVVKLSQTPPRKDHRLELTSLPSRQEDRLWYAHSKGGVGRSGVEDCLLDSKVVDGWVMDVVMGDVADAGLVLSDLQR